MLAQYGENCITQRKVYQWMERFQSGRTSIAEEDRSGCLNTSQTVDMLNELLLWFKRTDGLMSPIQLISWTSVVDLHTPLSTRTSGTRRFV